MTTLNLTIQEIFKLHQSGDLDGAIKLYKQFIDTLPCSEQLAQCHELLGIAHAQKTEYLQALKYFLHATQIKPNVLSIQNNLATCYKHLKQHKKALSTYLSILEHHPFQCVTHNNLASMYIQNKAYLDAKHHLQKAICLHPTYADAYFNLGIVFLHTSLEKSIYYFKKASDLGHLKAPYQAAQYYESKFENEDALNYYSLSIERLPQHAHSHHGKARVLLALQKDEDALGHLIEAQRIDPSIPFLMENIAAYYHVKGMHANAIEYWSKAPRTEENIVDINYNIGVAYQYANKHNEALEYFHQVLAHNPEHRNTHMNIAAIALQNNQRKSATKHYEIALNIDPKNEEIQFILAAIKQNTKQIIDAPSGYVANLFDQYAGHYNQHLMNMLKYQLPDRIELILHEQYKPSQALNILDLGCGTGLLAPKLSPFAKTLTGIDLSRNMIEQAKSTHLYTQLHQADCKQFLKESGKFDLIIAAELFPYVGDAEDLLACVSKCLPKDGILIFSIEKTDSVEKYALSESARFRHNPNWIETLCNRFGLNTLESIETTLRLHQSKPVFGQLFIFQST